LVKRDALCRRADSETAKVLMLRAKYTIVNGNGSYRGNYPSAASFDRRGANRKRCDIIVNVKAFKPPSGRGL
jgi:hypothetical protein